ncbi:MAG: hypothetical protein SHS37scaffold145_85 [Phage 71_18]|nr:MAG: hypothetical protein SHS37scaffold145_85 [Phage 71_18]
MLPSLFLLGLAAVAWLCAKAPPLARTVALAVVTVATLVLATAHDPNPTTLVAAAVVLATVMHVVLTKTDWQFRLSLIVPVLFTADYAMDDGTGRVRDHRSTWVQWRGHVVRHRSHALPG